MRLVAVILSTLCCPFLREPQAAWAAEPIKVLIVDGDNNHDWPRATRILTEILFEAGKFTVDVATSPPADAPEEAWAQWRPPFEDYDVVVSNFNGGHKSDSLHWPVEVERALEDYVREGGGLVVFHSANNSFPNWAAYNRMIGLGWRTKDFGPSLIVDQEEHVLRLPAGEGRNPGHGPAHSFQITRLDPDHPITRGLPRRWMHPTEQLTHGQHGPAENVRVLTYAFSRDTKENEVVDWVVPFGKGRVFVTMQGHLWRDQTDINLRCVGFRTILARGTEWAATGHLTSPVPKDFPTETETRVVEPSLGDEFEVTTKMAEDAYFLLEIPAAMLKGNPEQLSIHWIDFHRS